MRRVAEHNHMGADFNGIVRDGGLFATQECSWADIRSSRPFIHVEMLVGADKKGVEVHRGCGPCCAWCTCSDVLRLKLPWDPCTPPLNWDGPGGAAELLSRVCKHPFPSIPLIFEAAHMALPGEDLPRRCRFCKEVPFANVAEYVAAQQNWSRMRSDVLWSSRICNVFVT